MPVSFKKVLDWLAAALTVGTLLSFAGLIYVVLLQVYARLFMAQSPHWTEEASRFLFLFTVAFAAGPAIRRRAFVNVDVFINLIEGRFRTFIQLLIDLTMFLFMLLVSYYAWGNAKVGMMQTSPSLYIPMHYIFGTMFLLSASTSVFSAECVCKDIIGLFSGSHDEVQNG